ncbi:ComEC/Rec2 family competence protein [Lutibacter sp. TH_r2]|uniref:ComEC/Rec2 family competence protein n=1 Tax=Lutibacter sp. TH_r2 TaxID=3082083 RepID=UPI0029556949|nr:ComEC/Rec2 family competence protein [Lutibacter sp. TH_r2]MDV7187663.1 ComEC/Rec2 family competence protein [Lutibacter sp. TH_r2]
MLRFIPVQLTLYLIIGILFATYYSVEPEIIGVVSLFFVVCLALVYVVSTRLNRIGFVFSILVFIVVTLIGAASIIYKTQTNKTNHYTKQLTVLDSVNVSTLLIRKELKSNDFYFKYKAEIQELNSKKVTGKVLLNIQKDSINSNLKVDDLILVKNVFKTIPLPKNPFGFNYKKYLENQQIFHQITVYNNQHFKKVGKRKTIISIAAVFRENINNSLIKNGFKNEELAVINALLLGQRQTVSKDLLTDYSKAGAIHILAVSGLHIGIILLILSFILKPLELFKNGKIFISIAIIILLWMYAVVAGLSPSVVRAVTMFSALTIGIYANKPTNIYNTLFISMFFLLLIHPFYLFEVGFQLSYLAVFSIVWLQPKFASVWQPKIWIINKLWQLLTVSLAAQIGVAPLSIFYFNQFPGLFFVSNLVIIPFLGFLLVAGFLVIALALVDLLPKVIAEAYQFIIGLLNYFVGWVASHEEFILDSLSISFSILILWYVSFLLLFKWIEKKLFYRFTLFLTSLLLISTVLIFEKYNVETSSQFIVFHKNKESVIGLKNGNSFKIYSNDSIFNNRGFIRDYSLKNRFNKSEFIKSNVNYFNFNNEEILVVDSLLLFEFNSINPTIILLQNSPKINLERLINTYKPKLIVADGSNYKSSIFNWSKTCIKKKTPFYDTSQKGAFILNKYAN